MFTKELIESTIAHFKTKYATDISAEKAEEYLHAFADLFSAFEMLLREKHGLNYSKSSDTLIIAE